MLIFYPAIVEKGDTGFGVIFPDLPGCVSTGTSVQDAVHHATEALQLHLEGMATDGDPIPPPSGIDAKPDWLSDINEATRALIPTEMPGKTVRVQLTMDEALLRRVDSAASAEGFTRSGFLAQAARERLAHPGTHADGKVS